MRDLNKLADCLDLVLLRLRTGSTLQNSLQELPNLKATDKISLEWVKIREQIKAGEIPADQSIKSFSKNLRLQQKTMELLQEKTLMPRFQSYVISILSILLFCIAEFSFPQNLRPDLNESLLAAILILLSALTIHRMMKHFEATLWLSEWIMWLSQIRSSLAWGHTLASAMSKSVDQNFLKTLPKALATRLNELKLFCTQGECHPQKIIEKDSCICEAMEHLAWIQKLIEEGRPIGDLIDEILKHLGPAFERRLSKSAQLLSLKILAPLFLLSLPAFMILLFAPLLRNLSQGIQ